MPPASPVESPANSPADPVPVTAVREQLARVVSSPTLVSSPRLCRFLTHIVNRTIDGDLDNLKEFSVAMEVFDRTSDYDPNIDAIVRVEARRLRAKLKAYYEEGPGAADPVLIALRPGSYVPIFRWLDSKQPNHHPESGAAIRPGRASVAVLPFVNMSPEPEQDYFCDGISEEIINSLTRLSGLNVIARTSAFQFKGVSVDIREVGQRLGADLVIEGSVRKAGEQLRITAQAIQTESGRHLWSETFRRELKDVFAIQEEIARSVADLLQLHVPAAQTSVHASARNLKAYTRHLRARFLIHQQTPESLHAAAQQLRSVIEAFPDYAVAYSGLAAAVGYLCLFGVVSGRDVYPEVKANAERGYALDRESGETCAVLAGLRSWFEHRWEEAEALYERALQHQPGNADTHVLHAMTLLCQGNTIESESLLRRAAELDPLSASDCARMAYLHYVKGDYGSAAEHLRQSFELDHDYPEARLYEGLVRFQQEDYEGVVQCLSSSPVPLDIGLLAAASARRGDLSRARECLAKLREFSQTRYVTPMAEAFAAIGMGDPDLAFQRLDEAIDHKTNFINLLGIDPFYNPIRRDRRFPRLLKKLNLSH
jgi:serine/threonine-protein kinase